MFQILEFNSYNILKHVFICAWYNFFRAIICNLKPLFKKCKIDISVNFLVSLLYCNYLYFYSICLIFMLHLKKYHVIFFSFLSYKR
jgi:hypothetical protein